MGGGGNTVTYQSMFNLCTRFVGDVEKAKENKGVTVFEASKPRPGDKRKREDRGDPGLIEGYKGMLYMLSLKYMYMKLHMYIQCFWYCSCI